MSLFILLSQIICTLYLTGLIWFVQVVHYPLHGEVGDDHFQRYQELHMQWTSLVVMPPMIIELVTTIYLVIYPHPNTPSWIWLTAAIMLGIVWLSTGLLQVPAHSNLVNEFSILNHKKLVDSNWIRTVFWTGRSAILTWVLWKLLQ